MNGRNTDRARKVLALANQEAHRFNHEYVGTEHLLLGLIKEGRGVAAQVLKSLDVDLRKVRLEIKKILLSGPDLVTMRNLPRTPRAKKAIEYAQREARSLGHDYLGTEHILLGLLREREGVAAHVLMNLGLSTNKVREEVLSLISHGLAHNVGPDLADRGISEGDSIWLPHDSSSKNRVSGRAFFPLLPWCVFPWRRLVVVAIVAACAYFAAEFYEWCEQTKSEYTTVQVIHDVRRFVRGHHGRWPESWDDIPSGNYARDYVRMRFDVDPRELVRDPRLAHSVIQPLSGNYFTYPHAYQDLAELRDAIAEELEREPAGDIGNAPVGASTTAP